MARPTHVTENDISIRTATVNDIPAFLEYLRDLWEESLDVIYHSQKLPTQEKLEIMLTELENQSNSCMWFAYCQDHLVGVLDLHGDQHSQRNHVAGFGMSVAKPFRGKGIGRLLLRTMLRFAEHNEQLKRIELNVIAHNKNAIHLYESCGFSHEGRNVAAANIKDQLRDVLMMATLL